MSELQHVAEVLQAGMVTSIIPAHSSFEVDAMVDGEKLYIEPQIDALEQRITELEALLKLLDGGGHSLECDYHSGESCDCGHDAVAKYFEGVGK